uniref:Uncharacterized protein n=1 Tax=Rhizophora mucronata TaxID=61149 RepID=A0A2P2R120_RHIMU
MSAKHKSITHPSDHVGRHIKLLD